MRLIWAISESRHTLNGTKLHRTSVFFINTLPPLNFSDTNTAFVSPVTLIITIMIIW